MKTVVLDDDPTGTQSATGVRVLLESDADLLTEALRLSDSVYVQTNSRAIDEDAAVRLVSRVKADAEEAARRLGEELQFVLRGDSTLRGHVFAETEVFLDHDDAVMLFVPAFPDGGRTTVDGVHLVRVGEEVLPAHETEYAQDPVFPFSTGILADYVREKSSREPVGVPLSVVRGDASALATALASAPAGSVLLPDALTDDDIRRIAAAVQAARVQGAVIVVRSAAPLAAALAGVQSQGLLPRPIVPSPRPTLLACGSHTGGAAAQLARLREEWGEEAVIDTAAALADPVAGGRAAADRARTQLADRPLTVVTTERVRSAENNTLAHGEKVMTALTTAVRDLLPAVEVVVAKGGITSAEVARTGIGATWAYVAGQVLPGVSVWRMLAHDGREITYVVVPGNVGGPETLADVLDAVGLVPVPAPSAL
ncbi:four-carbon acid sugar kinase family protein [Leifsonia sp. F6_8S_P_1B]|uniref:Four-carbon acid sugar kinase family protein n=1 Tax=Leifsonia williamsii TaxID=3035919 RepID=A0ABT8KE95_9MICO|nr:four-carbon acid sugar kinase family protein [Leifsonia williamsii]MDN4615788.1 four-carbon acid sugar kinase family protein [Leifsonia williamsii]